MSRDYFGKAPKPYEFTRVPLRPGFVPEPRSPLYGLAEDDEVDAPLLAPEPAPAPRRSLATQIAEDEMRDSGRAYATDQQIADAANVRFNADRELTRTPSQRAARGMVDELRMSPGFAFMSSGLNTATMGLDDEIIGAGLTGMSRLGLLDDELEYRDTQRALDDARVLSSEAYPAESNLGTVSGMAASLPLMEATIPRIGAEGLTLARAARTVAPYTAGGAVLGGAGGYLGAEEGDEIGATLRGAGTGALFGTAAPAMVLGGRVLGAGTRGATRTLGGAALEGGGYSIGAAPGASTLEVTDPNLFDEAIGAGLTGAAIGAPVAAGASLLSRPARIVAERRGRSGANVQPVAPGLIDETAIDIPEPVIDGDQPFVDETIAPIGGMTPREAADAAAAEYRNQPLLHRIVSSSLRRNPDVMRTFSTGIANRSDVRAAEAGFGDLGRFVGALNEAGIAMPGSTYSIPEARAASRAAHERANAALQAVHEEVAARDVPIAGSRIAERYDEIAADALRANPNETDRAIANAAAERALDFRYGTGVRPSASTEYLTDLDSPTVARGSRGRFERVPPRLVEADVIDLPPDYEMAYPDLRLRMRRDAEVTPLANAFRGAGVQPTPQQEALRRGYRGLADVRDEEVLATIGPERFEEYLRNNRISRATGIVNRAPYERSHPADLRSAIGRASGGSGILGAAMGHLREQAIGQYQHSILAALNETGDASAAALADRAIAMATPHLPAETAMQIELLARDVRAGARPAAELTAAVEAAAAANPNVNVARAASMLSAPNQWNRALQTYRQLTTISPEAAERFARGVDDAASLGTFTAATAAPGASADAITRERIAGETEDAQQADPDADSFLDQYLPAEEDAAPASDAPPADDEDEFLNRILRGR